MATTERIVMAYDEHGQLVPTLESETVSVPSLPVKIDMHGGTPMTPSLARFFARRSEGLPHKLISIEKATWRDGRLYLAVQLRSKPFLRFELAGKKYMGDTRLVCVFDERDARDPYFAKLPELDRQTIIAAMRQH